MIPGAIDVHTHMELPFGGTFAKDTFETGTRAAAFGGTTTIIDFAVQGKGQALREGLDAWHAKAEGKATIDYGFHMIMSDVTDATLAEMDTLVEEGVTDFKLFTAYPGVFFSDDGAIFRAMQQTAKNGGLILMHAENGLAIDVVAAQNADAGNTDPYYHGVSRSPVLEGEATNRVIRLAQVAGVPVYIVHLSAIDALDEVRRARDEGLPAYAETCPQYLFLTLEDLGNGFEGAKFVCSPPLRPADHAPELWKGLAKDDLQVVSTDHCPFDFHGQKDLGKGDFRKVPNGLPGVEDRVNLLHSGGVVERAPDAEPMGRGHLHGAGADVRPRRPQGRRRGRSRCGPRRLRPVREAHDQREDAPHGRRLLDLRGLGGHRPSRDRDDPRQGDRRRRRVARRGRRRPLPEADADRGAAGPHLIRPLDCSRRAICPIRRSLVNRHLILVALLAIFLAACGTQTADEADATLTPEPTPAPTTEAPEPTDEPAATDDDDGSTGSLDDIIPDDLNGVAGTAAPRDATPFSRGRSSSRASTPETPSSPS